MSEEIEIKTESDVMDLVFKLTRFEMQYPKMVTTDAMLVVNEEIVDKIRDTMEEKGYSDKIIQKVRAELVTIDTDGFVEIDIISDFETDESFDVAKMMEEGRVAYKILPRIKDMLKWIFEGRWISKHEVNMPQRPGDKIFDSVFDEMEDIAQDRLDDKLDEKLDRSLNS